MNTIISFNLYSDVSCISSQKVFHQQNAAFRSFVALFISYHILNMTICERYKKHRTTDFRGKMSGCHLIQSAIQEAILLISTYILYLLYLYETMLQLPLHLLILTVHTCVTGDVL